MKNHTRSTSLAAALTALSVLVPTVASAHPLDDPMSSSWPIARSWTAGAERQYSRFVARIGAAVAAGRCGTLERCLNNPAINPLYEAGARPLRIHADCADVAYVLRAYFSYRNALPFAWTSHMIGNGRDPRYMLRTRSAGRNFWFEAPTPRHLLENLGSTVHSGYFRLSPEDNDGDTYVAAVNRDAIHPGTTYYNPNGHVLVVWDVAANGTVRFIDGHPDNSMSHPEFSVRQPRGAGYMGGGFRNFRPLVVRDGLVVALPNREIPHYGGRTQYTVSDLTGTGQRQFVEWVQTRLATRDGGRRTARTRVSAEGPYARLAAHR